MAKAHASFCENAVIALALVSCAMEKSALQFACSAMRHFCIVEWFSACNLRQARKKHAGAVQEHNKGNTAQFANGVDDAFLPSAACRFFDLLSVELQNLQLHRTKKAFVACQRFCAVIPYSSLSASVFLSSSAKFDN